MTLFVINSIFAVAFALYLFVPYVKKRQTILILMLIASTLYGLTLFLQNELAGSFSCIIANVFILMNAVVPKDKLDATFRARIIILLIASVVVGFYTINSFTDILPFVAMMGTRLCETFKDPRNIKRGYFVTLCVWFSYIASLGNVFMLTLESVRLINFIVGLYKSETEPNLGKMALRT